MRLRLLNNYPMDRDEFARVVPEFTLTSLVPPGFLFLTKLSALIFNYSDFGFRLPVFLSGILGIFLIYLLGKTLFGKLEGILAAFVLSILLTHIGYSNQTKEYVPLMSFATLSSIFVFKIISSILDKRKLDKERVSHTEKNTSEVFEGLLGRWRNLLLTSPRRSPFGSPSEVVSKKVRNSCKEIVLFYGVVSFLGVFFSSYFYFLVIAYQLLIISLVFLITNFKNIPFRKFFLNFPLNLVTGAVFIVLCFAAFSLINKADAYFGIKIIAPQLSFISKYWQELGYFVTQDLEFTKATNLIFLIGSFSLPWLSQFRRGVFYLLSFIALDFLLVATLRFEHMAFPIYYIRYHAFLLPLYVVMLSGTIGGLVYLLEQREKKFLAKAVIVIFIFFNLWKAYPMIKWYYRLPSIVSTNFKDAGKYLTDHLRKGDTLVRIKNFSMEQKYNHVNHYVDKKVLESVNYSIFPERNAQNNWYVTLGPGDEDELGFSDFFYVERIRSSLRYGAPFISKLKYYGPFVKTRKLINSESWQIKVSSGQSSVSYLTDGDFQTAWEGEDFKTMTIDLGRIYTLNSVRLYFSQLYPQKFTLWLSENGLIKKEMFKFRDLNVDPTNSQIFFEPTKARFIIIELKGSGIKELAVWEVYEKEIKGLDKTEIVDNGLPGMQIKDSQSANGFAQLIPYDQNEDYTFFQIGEKLALPKGRYKLNFRIKVDKIVPDWRENLATPPAYRLYEYLEPKETSDNDILYVSLESTRGTFFEIPVRVNIHGDDFKEANRYYPFSLIFKTDGRESLFIQAFNPKNRRYPANLMISYPEIERRQ